MKPAPFRYLAATSFDEALGFKAQHGADARFLAGGQSLVPILNFRLAQPKVLIDINGLAAGRGIARAGDRLRIGALTRYRDLQRDAQVSRHCPLIAEALPHIAHPQIRNRGTIGGNLCHADPASELPAVLLALNGSLKLRSSRGERTLDARSFFTGPLTTALADEEMLAEIEIPLLVPRTGTSFLEVSRRRGDFAIVGVAAVVALADDDSCRDARLAYCGAGDRPMLASSAAAALVGTRLDEKDIDLAGEVAASEVEPSGSVHASADYQRHLAGVLARRALRTALGRAKVRA